MVCCMLFKIVKHMWDRMINLVAISKTAICAIVDIW